MFRIARHSSLLTRSCRRVYSPALSFRTPSAINLCHFHSEAPTRHASVLQIVASRFWSATHRQSTHLYGRARPSPRGPNRFTFWDQISQLINRIPSKVFFWGIFGINGAVFICWNLAIAQYVVSENSYAVHFMHRNFITSMESIREGRYWTLITSVFSHKDIIHALFNAIPYYLVAPSLFFVLGNTSFLTLYLGGGLASNIVSLWWHTSVVPSSSKNHGASGALYGLLSFFACIAPNRKFLLFYIVPVPAWLCISLAFALEGYNAATNKVVAANSPAHITGMLSGIAYYIFRMRFR